MRMQDSRNINTSNAHCGFDIPFFWGVGREAENCISLFFCFRFIPFGKKEKKKKKKKIAMEIGTLQAAAAVAARLVIVRGQIIFEKIVGIFAIFFSLSGHKTMIVGFGVLSEIKWQPHNLKILFSFWFLEQDVLAYEHVTSEGPQV